jgi:hypothetical protein
LQVFKLDKPDQSSDETGRYGIHHRIELLGDVVVGIALPGNFFLNSLYRVHQTGYRR